MLAATFLTLALFAGLLGFSGLSGAPANTAWAVLVVLFVLALGAAIGRVLTRMTTL